MRITQVRINLNVPAQTRVRAFCTLTLEASFMLRDIKIIEGPQGLFIAMPSRKHMDSCLTCRHKNHLRARFCNHCGVALDENRHASTDGGFVKLQADIAHPIHAGCRAMIQEAIMKAFHKELARSRQPGYVAPRLDLDEGDDVAA